MVCALIISTVIVGLCCDHICVAQEIIDALCRNKDVSTLELKGNTLGVSAANAIGRALEQQSHIKVIR